MSECVHYIGNDRTFCVIILEGYGVAGMYIVVSGHSDRMFGCLRDRVMCLPPRRWCQAAPRGSLSVCLGRSSSYIVNCRNYEYYTVCDISMCCSMDLSMYSKVYENCIMNPRGDKC